MTTTDLVRELPREMELLLWTRQLQPVAFDEYTLLRLFSDATCCLRHAQKTEQSLVVRFFVANESIHALSLAVLYLHGVLPTGWVGQLALAMQLACELLAIPAPLTNEILNFNTHRELIAYGSTEPVCEPELQALMAHGETLLEQARYEFPEWTL